MTDATPNIATFTPTDLLNIVKEHLKTTNTRVVVEGIYSKVGKMGYGGGMYWYDELKSPSDNNKITVKVPTPIRNKVENNNLVQFCGTVEKNLNPNGQISINFLVSDFLKQEEKTVTDEEREQLQILQEKASKGNKNVDSILEKILYEGERKPRVVLLFAETSITEADFRSGIQAASGMMDFKEQRVTFTRIDELTAKLKEIDAEKQDAVCLIRGGGKGIEEVFSQPLVARSIMDMVTPTITAIGHEPDNPLSCKVSDRNIGTPSLLGQYFKDMVERIAAERNNSKAVLVEQVRKQFQKEITNCKEQIDKLTKAQKEIQESHKKAIEELTNANKKAIEELTKANKEQIEKITANQKNEQLLHNKAIADLTKANKESQENAAKQYATQIAGLQKEREEYTVQNKRMIKEIAELKSEKSHVDSRVKAAENKYKGPTIILAILLVMTLAVLVLTMLNN